MHDAAHQPLSGPARDRPQEARVGALGPARRSIGSAREDRQAPKRPQSYHLAGS